MGGEEKREDLPRLDHMERQTDALQLRELLESRRELGAWNEKRVVALAGARGLHELHAQ